MKLCKFLLPIFLAISALGYAQNSNTTEQKYLVFDPSNSLPGNIDHDKLYFLRMESHTLELGNLNKIIEDYNLDYENSHKIKSSWISFLKVFINPNVSLEDKDFVYSFLKNMNDVLYNPLLIIIDEHVLYKQENN
jgi:hypothetical protein